MPQPNHPLIEAQRHLCAYVGVHTLEAAFVHCYCLHVRRPKEHLEQWELEMIATDALRCGPGRGGFPAYAEDVVERIVAARK